MRCSYNGCQFDGPENDLFERNASQWCIFHLPIDGRKGDPTDKRSWDKESIRQFNSKLCEEITKGKTDFRNIFFPAGIDLSGVAFPNNINFDRATFLRGAPAHIKNAQFDGLVSFFDVNFLDDVFFDDTLFKGSASFEKAVFHKEADFTNVTFKNRSNFNYCEFHNDADFNYVRFCSGSHFSDCLFKCHSNFHHANFNDNTYFSNTKFGTSASFLNANFMGDVDFHFFSGDDTSIYKKRDDVPFHSVDYTGATFKGTVNYNNRIFSTTTRFRDTTFFKAPKFFNCDLHQDTDFEGAIFKDFSPESSSAYRVLKLTMENIRDRRGQAKFFSYEQKCLRKNKDTPHMERFFSKGYEISSSYGERLLTPFLWFIFIQSIFTFIYCHYFSSETFQINQSTGRDLSITEIVGFSLEQVFKPFHIWKTAADTTAATLKLHSLILKILASIHSGLSLMLFSIFLLVLRWRFKRA